MSERINILLATSAHEAHTALLPELQQQGWHVEVAGDATAALVQARRERPDTVLLDAGLAGGGALITLKRLRASVDTAAIPVLVFGSSAITAASQFQAAGAGETLEAVDAVAVAVAIRRHLAPAAPVLTAPAEAVANPARMAALRASGLLDSAPEEAFDRVTHLVTRLLGAPTALISLVDKDRQFFKSRTGLPEPWATAGQTPLTHSFCQWVVCGREPVTVNDARLHPVLKHNAAIRDIGVVAYTGVPIATVQGETLGSLCAIDAKPREWGTGDRDTMHDLARLAENCVARAQLVQQPPQSAQDFDHFVETAGAAIDGALGILRRHGDALSRTDRELLHELIGEYGHHLVQLNRLIQVNQLLR